MTNLLPEQEKCLQRHSQHILKHMAPDGVYLYMSGAKLLDDADHDDFNAQDDFGKNHALLRIVARHGRTGFHTFLEALDTTRQVGIADRIRVSLNEKYSNVEAASISNIENGGTAASGSKGIEISSSLSSYGSQLSSSPLRSARGHTPMFSRGSPQRLSRSHSLPGTSTPQALTPPLTEDELNEHLDRMKTLLHKISTTHSDRFCRQEAAALYGELDDAGEAMMWKVRQLSQENSEKERELRNAKYMVRGLETEIERLRSRRLSTFADSNGVADSNSAEVQRDTNRGKTKSKLCVIL